MNSSKLVDDLTELLRSTAVLRSCASVLGWDEQTFLPPQGAEHRARQSSMLAGMIHERATAPRIGEILDALESQPVEPHDLDRVALLRETRRTYDRMVKLPRRLVEELSHTTTLSQQAWVESKKRKEFAHFRPWLEKVIALKREEADAVSGPGTVRYNALLDDYEPGSTITQVQTLFAPLRTKLVAFAAAIRDSGRRPETEILEREYPIEQQREFSGRAATAIGFDFSAGRLDEAAHPFCSGLGPGDCRLTTRYNAHHFPGAFFGTLHEAGHGIYEQGLPREKFGTPLGEAASLGIHESQSRMWENFVGRSRPFWEHFYPQAQATFPQALSDVSLDRFHFAINDVRPSFIRVEADEVTYNLHIMLRFELEQALISGDLAPADLPGAWNQTFQQFFGLTPSDDSLGCLQDVHWSAGLIGYFPTYALGNMCAAQFFQKAEQEVGNLSGLFAQGDFQPLKTWLNQKIHVHGQRYRPNQ